MTPLYEALERQFQKKRLLLHMPGHKGQLPSPFEGCSPFDLTELPETGNLYGNGGPISLCEEQFEHICQSGATLLCAGGSTLCVQSMLSLFCPVGSKVLMGRNCHVSAVNTAALLNLSPVWLMPDQRAGSLSHGRVTPDAVEKALLQSPDVSAVYLTSPDYFGVMCDIGRISAVCRRHQKPLLVDNAHGAHLVFFGLHPIELGADACCDSLHKTLPALTGAALLHLKDRTLKEAAKHSMSIFGSSSPSYLIMLSADLLSGELAAQKEPFLKLAQRVEAIKALSEQKWGIDGLRDPVRISLSFAPDKLLDVKSLLDALSIEPEALLNGGIILIPSPFQDLTPVDELATRLPT